MIENATTVVVSVCASAGAFPSHESRVVHFAWVGIYIADGLAWFYVQGYTAWALARHLRSSHVDARQQYTVAIARAACLVVITGMYIVFLVCLFSLEDHAAASIAELTLAVFWSAYFATLFPEFNRINLSLTADCEFEASPTPDVASSPGLTVNGGVKCTDNH